jgi:hypothetical protein
MPNPILIPERLERLCGADVGSGTGNGSGSGASRIAKGINKA